MSNNTEDYGINLPTAMTVAAFTAIAWVNTIELQIRIWWNFKRYKGLYFWALVAASAGCAIHPLGFIMFDFDIWTNVFVCGVVIDIGWWTMVTGQALVLYSRLHLVMRSQRKLRLVLYMIIMNFFILHIPVSTLGYISYSNSPYAASALAVYNVYEKVQMTGFTIQETIISGLYLYETRKMLRPGQVFKKKKTREVMKHLIYINAFIIFLDLALLSTEYASLFDIETVFKAAVYSLKLRFEFVILNQLLEVVQGNSSDYGRDSKNTANNTTLPLDATVNSTANHYHTWSSNQDSILPRTVDSGDHKVAAVAGLPPFKRDMDGFDVPENKEMEFNHREHTGPRALPPTPPGGVQALGNRVASRTSSEVDFARYGA